MKKMLVQIPDDAIGTRLDQWVAANTSLTRSAFKQQVEKQLVSFNDNPIKKAGVKISVAGSLVIDEEDTTRYCIRG